jgi:hypothetical protein
MQLEVARSLVDALGHHEYGIQVQLATLPTDEADDVATLVPVIVDGTKDRDEVTGSQFPAASTLLVLVTLDGPTTTRSGTAKGEFSFASTPIAVTVVHRGSAPIETKVAQAEYMLRAIVLAVKAFFDRPQGERTRNEVTLLEATSVRYGLVQDDGMGALGAVVFTVDALDKRAQRSR